MDRAPILEHMPENEDENRVRLRDDVSLSLKFYMHEKAAQISGIPGVQMTKTAVVNEVMMNFLAKEGHYPPKVDKAEAI
jgi:hypothetical protein